MTIENEWLSELNRKFLYAAEEGFVGLVQDYIGDGADINAMNIEGDTATHLAAANCHLAVLIYLIERGADLKKLNFLKQTALHHAVLFSDNLECARYLIDKKVDVHAKDENGDTPFHVAVTYRDIKTVEYFLKNDADLMSKNNQGNTVMDVARNNQRHPNVYSYLEFHVLSKKIQKECENVTGLIKF